LKGVNGLLDTGVPVDEKGVYILFCVAKVKRFFFSQFLWTSVVSGTFISYTMCTEWLKVSHTCRLSAAISVIE
jgi:hypothetical protein